MTTSIWDASVTENTDGILNKKDNFTVINSSTGSQLIYSIIYASNSANRFSSAIPSSYVVNNATAYWTYLAFTSTATLGMGIYTHATNDALGSSAGPQLTSAARSNIGIAIRTSDNTVYKWQFPSGDTTEPYIFTHAQMSSAGSAYSATMMSKIIAGAVDVVFLDRTNSNINWTNLTVTSVGSAITIDMHERTDNRVFGNTRIALQPTITNPGGGSLSYAWTQTGGLTVVNPSSSSTFVDFPSAPASITNASVTLTVTDSSNTTTSKTINFRRIPNLSTNNSLFHENLSSTSGLVWLDFTSLRVINNQDKTPNGATIVDSRFSDTISNTTIKSEYITIGPGQSGYVNLIWFRGDGQLDFTLGTTSSDSNTGISAGPQLTSSSRSNLGLALVTPDGTIRKWIFSELTKSDSTEPYRFSSSSVTSAGDANNATLRTALRGVWSVGVLLTDRTNSNINWTNVTRNASATDPVVNITTTAQNVDSGSDLTLAATATDPQNQTLTYAWTTSPINQGSFDNSSSLNPTWTAPTVTTDTEITLTLTATDTDNNTNSDSVIITVLKTTSTDIVVSLPTRTDNRVFGNTRIYLSPTVTNPVGNTLSYSWTHTGGVSISDITNSSTFVTFGDPPSTITNTTITLRATDTVTSEYGEDSITFRRVPNITPSNSLFNVDLASTSGLAWVDFLSPISYSSDTDNTINGSVVVTYSVSTVTRTDEQIKLEYVQTIPAYVTLIWFLGDGQGRIRLSTDPNDSDSGIESGPQLTTAALQNLGLAIITPDGTIRKWNFSSLLAGDTTEPYTILSSAIDNAGPANNVSLRTALSSVWTVGVLIADTTNSNINWTNVTSVSDAPDVVVDVSTENSDPTGIWSNGTYIWIADKTDQKIYAYNLTTNQRVSSQDFNRLDRDGIEEPGGIWSNGTTMWIMSEVDNKVYAYNLSTKARDSSKDIGSPTSPLSSGNLRTYDDTDIWGDSTTMWVVSKFVNKAFAFNVSDQEWSTNNDFTHGLNNLSSSQFRGIWGDSSNIYITDANDRKVYAFDKTTKNRNPDADFGLYSSNSDPRGLWGNATTIWVADGSGRIFSYRRSLFQPTIIDMRPLKYSGDTQLYRALLEYSSDPEDKILSRVGIGVSGYRTFNGEYYLAGRVQDGRRSAWTDVGVVSVYRENKVFVDVIPINEYSGSLQKLHLCPTDGYRRIEMDGPINQNDIIKDTGNEVFISINAESFPSNEDKWIPGGRGIGLPITAVPGEDTRLLLFSEDSDKNKITDGWTVTATYRARRLTI